MFGAILGDIVGSRFEFDVPGWKKEFEFLASECNWTDDTAMTIAVAEALLKVGKDAEISVIEHAVIDSMRDWGKRYPYAGFGGRFNRWLASDDPKPYESYGNGSAMRVSAVGWLYDSLDRSREVAAATARVTHNHPEGIKGAECTAAVIFLGRTGASKEEIAEYINCKFGYDYSESMEEMRARHRHDESCMDALPKAIRSFMDGTSVEDVIRNAVSLGGDTDTIAAIAGAMAEGFYGMPVLYKGEVMQRVEDDMLEVLRIFDKTINPCMEVGAADQTDENATLADIYQRYYDEQDQSKKGKIFDLFLNELSRRVKEGGTVLAPYVDATGNFFSEMEFDKLCVGDAVTVKNSVRLRLDTMTDQEGHLWIPLFLGDEARTKGQTANILMPTCIRDILELGLKREDLTGVVINPFDRPFEFRKNMLYHFLRDYC